MRHVALVLAGLPGALPAVVAGAGTRPALDYWLDRADVGAGTDTDWRHWLARQAGGASMDLLLPDAPGERYWLATPVHWVAGLDTVRVHPEGLVSLTSEEQAQLAGGFATVFADSGWQLLPTGARELLVRGDAAPVATQDPTAWLGLSPREGMARGAGAATLQRFGAEVEMWLHEHPLNQARVAAGALPVNALWLWGGGRVRAAPAAWSGMEPAADGESGRLIVLEGGNDELARLERDWLQPALAAWRAGHVGTLTLIAFGGQYTLRRAARWRFWRRPGSARRRGAGA